VDIYAALVEKRAYRLQFTHAKAFGMMEKWATRATSICCTPSARWRSGITERSLHAVHCERSEAIHLVTRGWMDCFAPLAMTRRTDSLSTQAARLATA